MTEPNDLDIAAIPPEEVDSFPMGDAPDISQDAVDLGARNPE